jgi:phosphoglycolate phosphatase-like HAD superfamily hydrolase
MRATILLFDIDGTLITSGGVGRRSIERAFRERYRRDDACNFPFDGMTDRQIARRGITAIGLTPTESAMDEILDVYLDVLRVEVARADEKTYRLHEGTREAIRAARERGHAIGLGTGNVVEGARIKLGKVGVFEEFAFGGFGSDAEDRTELIRRGAERGAEHAGAPLAECRVVVIGDTPKDVAAAKGIGAECLGVGTGRYSKEDLLGIGATHAFDSLLAPGALAALLG